ncbi:PhoH family protein [Saccharicrinis sp. FJH54]|uniref:PhoH family protein n=1 Tax=Saccharicrinis sp. FJH54 TaxID=3344665 RepID=UPI0035D49857
MERIIVLEDIDPVTFYGANNANLDIIKALYPKLRIVARGSIIKANGSEEVVAEFEEKINDLIKYTIQYNQLTEKTIREIILENKIYESIPADAILYSTSGRPIVARTPNQKKFVDAFYHNDLLFAIGPAGSGKTYTAIALAARALKNKEIRKIILSRPAVEAGERLGFLPGDLKEKIDPYLQPLYDALKDMIPATKLKEYTENETIQIAPLAYMRGRTLNDAIVILDEAQNTTRNQLKMFLTRMGRNAKFIVTGDVTQIDLPSRQDSGLVQAMQILKDIEGIKRITFNAKDIVRHRLVQKIVEAYEKE